MSTKVIVDAGILTAAYGKDADIARAWRESFGDCKVIISPEIFIEVEARFRNGESGLSEEEIRAALSDILSRCEVVRPPAPADSKLADARTAQLGALARHQYPDKVRPRWLVTNDETLLRLAAFGACKIASLADFCKAALAAVAEQRP